MATKTKTKTKKKRQNIPSAINIARVYVNATFNNTLISITDDEGNMLSWSSAGHLGFKGSRKSTPYAAQMAVENAMEKAKAYNIKSFRIYIIGIGPGRESAIRAFHANKNRVIEVKDLTPIPHNGCRPKKPRKV